VITKGTQEDNIKINVMEEYCEDIIGIEIPEN
jgi:hypothetical protein